MDVAILLNSLVLKSTKTALFYVTPSIPVFLRLHQNNIPLRHSF